MVFILRFTILLTGLLFTFGGYAFQSESKKVFGDSEDWVPIFNGRDLKGWSPKIRGYELGDDPFNTFRVNKKGELIVSYDGYEEFDSRFGHLAFHEPFGFVAIRFKYRFFGEQCSGGEDWAYKNSGLMILGESPKDMTLNQDFPESIELQLLGAPSRDSKRPTANVCTPGTHIDYQGKLDKRHCINSASSSFFSEDWVEIEVHINSDNSIDHFVNGKLVLTYEQPVIGGDMVNPPKDAQLTNKLLESGFIYLQSESHPIAFKDIEVLRINK